MVVLSNSSRTRRSFSATILLLIASSQLSAVVAYRSRHHHNHHPSIDVDETSSSLVDEDEMEEGNTVADRVLSKHGQRRAGRMCLIALCILSLIFVVVLLLDEIS